MSYDRAITVFSPDGHLLQVEYSMEVSRIIKTTEAMGQLPRPKLHQATCRTRCRRTHSSSAAASVSTPSPHRPSAEDPPSWEFKEKTASFSRWRRRPLPSKSLLAVICLSRTVLRGVLAQGAPCSQLNSTQLISLYQRLQDSRTIRKIVSVDQRTVLAFAGLTADARVLINKVRVEAQSYRLTMEDDPSVDYIGRYLARVQQQYTQQGGVRPFGVASLIAGVAGDQNDPDKPLLYQTDPAGTHSRWKAQVVGGRNAKSLREFLEKQYHDNLTQDECVRLAVQALLEVVDSGAKTMEICVIQRGGVKVNITEAQVDEIVKAIEAEQQDEKRGTASASE